jgi:hypothetical protein
MVLGHTNYTLHTDGIHCIWHAAYGGFAIQSHSERTYIP